MGDVENGAVLGLPLTKRSRVRQMSQFEYTCAFDQYVDVIYK